ncbi:MAG: HPr(Ser) kinase/phosphatase [Gemmatimonadetes bacterium]|nr:HPr(Ser) kinase/phosphatase [Gemmatimonadota bacterium]
MSQGPLPGALSVADFLEQRGAALQLAVLAGASGLDRKIGSAEAASPGLVLSGFTDRFPKSRLQVLGETEIRYLNGLSDEELRQTVDRYLAFELPCIIVTKGLQPPPYLARRADERGIPVVGTALSTSEFYKQIKIFLDRQFAPSVLLHGSLADVYGVGLLFQGSSGIGKSECVLDLVERGHRLVADDQVHVTRRAGDVLIGRANELLGFHMEIRGVGIIDIQSLFGIRAVRLQKRIEVVVTLEHWDDRGPVERVGLDERHTDILGVPIPLVSVPLNPGKNLTVIAEVVAMQHLEKFAGRNTAQAFNDRLIQRMQDKARLEAYLEEDFE